MDYLFNGAHLGSCESCESCGLHWPYHSRGIPASATAGGCGRAVGPLRKSCMLTATVHTRSRIMKQRSTSGAMVSDICNTNMYSICWVCRIEYIKYIIRRQQVRSTFTLQDFTVGLARSSHSRQEPGLGQ